MGYQPQQGFPPMYDQQQYADDGNVDFIEKKKDKLKKDVPFEHALEGYLLEPTDVSNISKGQLNWSRVGKHPLNFTNAKLSEISRKVYLEKRLGPMTVFNSLSADQRGVITRLIEDCQSHEKDKNAIWVLECVRKYNKEVRKNWRHGLIVCNKMMVIVKRKEKHAGKDGSIPYKPNTFQASEIIDLSVPSKKKDKKKKSNREDEWEQPMENNPDMFQDYGHGAGPGAYEVPAHHHAQGANDVGPFPGVPVGAIPVPDQWQQPQQQLPGVYPNNPFNAAYEPPQFEQRREPPVDARVFAPSPPLDYDPRSQSRSRSRRRREDDVRRQNRELRRKNDELEDRMERMNMRDRSPRSSEDSYREPAYWSGASGGSITPPSSPSRSDYAGRRKQYRRESYPRGYYGDGSAFMEPYSNTDRRREREDRVPGGIMRVPSTGARRQRRAMLHQDDYPDNPVGGRNRRALPEVAGEGYYPADFNDRDRRRRSRGREGDRVYRDDLRGLGRRVEPW